MDLKKRLRQLFGEGNVGEGDAVIQHGEIHMASGDVRKRKERDVNFALAYTELLKGAGDVGSKIAMGEDDAFRVARGAGGVDECGKVFWSDLAGMGEHPLGGLVVGGLEQALHADGMRGFNAIHDDDFVDRNLVVNGKDLLQLLLSGNKNRARLGVVQDESRLTSGE